MLLCLVGGEMTEMIDTIFVTGLNEAITEDALVNHFGSIGVIKVNELLNQGKQGKYFNVKCYLQKSELEFLL